MISGAGGVATEERRIQESRHEHGEQLLQNRARWDNAQRFNALFMCAPVEKEKCQAMVVNGHNTCKTESMLAVQSIGNYKASYDLLPHDIYAETITALGARAAHAPFFFISSFSNWNRSWHPI
jgi:hypothetical protein